MTKEQVLSTLDNCLKNEHWQFISLNHPYVYTIDSRINVFRDGGDRWAIAAEVLGFDPRGGEINLQIFYFGNCLDNLRLYQGKPVNNYEVFPVDYDQFLDTIDDGGECLLPEAKFWLVRGVLVNLTHHRKHYLDAGIELQEDEQISAVEATRLLIISHNDLFRATDEELYESVPKDLKKLLVIDQWYHREIEPFPCHFYDDAEMERFGGPESFFIQGMLKRLEESREKWTREWEENRPGGYETWQQIADVIVTGDISLYRPTLEPNSHWRNWPKSGSM